MGIQHRAEVDGLRGIAVAAVVLYHFGFALPGGFAGVDVFFVISGYVITLMLASEYASSGRIDFTGFYLRRARRLLPALVLVLLFAIAAAIAIGGEPELVATTLQSAGASLLFVANLFFQAETGDYFAPAAERLLLLHTWSLSVEEQFYLLFPALLLLLLKRGAALPGLAALCVASFLLATYWAVTSPTVAFYQMPSRFWEMGLGACLALLPAARLGFAATLAASYFGALLLVLGLAMTPVGGLFPGPGALPAALGTGLILLARQCGDPSSMRMVGELLRAAPVRYLGTISYSLYLWHWPLIALATLLVVDMPPAQTVALLAASIALAAASFHLIEQPIRRGRFPLASRQMGMRYAGVAALLCASVLMVGFGGSRTVEARTEAARLVRDRPPDDLGCHKYTSGRLVKTAPAKCVDWPNRRWPVLLIGDSHAYAWGPLGARLAENSGRDFLGVSMDACFPGDVDGDTACARHNREVLGAIEANVAETVIVSARWTYHLGRAPAGDLDKVLRRISKRASRVVILGPTPEFSESPAKCYQASSLGCTVSREAFLASSAEARRVINEAAAGLPNVTVLDPSEIFCAAGTCSNLVANHALVWDTNHVTTWAATSYADEAAAAIR